MTRATSAEDYKLISSFETVRSLLSEEKFADRLQKPLAYWALPNDRRLPLAFLGRTIADLLNTPFDELSATAGIGQKKIASLVKLLHRATEDTPPAVPFGLSDLTGEEEGKTPPTEGNDGKKFDPSMVSESLWVKWQKTVREHGVDDEKLGRLAPTLQALPTVIWHKPLGEYLGLPVSEIRQLKTHGEKRVRVVLEVFYVVNSMLERAGKLHHLAIRLVPKFVPPIAGWMEKTIADLEPPDEKEIRENLVQPLLDQIKIDVGDTVYDLARGRLGIGGPAQSVRTQSRQLGVTRARIYQLLDECSKAMSVRWPEGKTFFNELAAKFHAEDVDTPGVKAFRSIRELIYPEKYDQTREEDL